MSDVRLIMRLVERAASRHYRVFGEQIGTPIQRKNLQALFIGIRTGEYYNQIEVLFSSGNLSVHPISV